jgi:hypothetical protein
MGGARICVVHSNPGAGRAGLTERTLNVASVESSLVSQLPMRLAACSVCNMQKQTIKYMGIYRWHESGRALSRAIIGPASR